MSYDAVLEWVSLADFYTFPHITTFDSFEELIGQLTSINLFAISEGMHTQNELDKVTIVSAWQQILRTVDAGKQQRQLQQHQAQDYKPAMQSNKRTAVNTALNANYGIQLSEGCMGYDLN
jgi:replicative DNA helicase